MAELPNRMKITAPVYLHGFYAASKIQMEIMGGI
jgi:hypothetical protein